jgi:hypothetical protein
MVHKCRITEYLLTMLHNFTKQNDKCFNAFCVSHKARKVYFDQLLNKVKDD